MPAHEIRLSARVHAPVDRVFPAFADHERFARLFGASCTRIKEGRDDPNGLGSVRRVGPGPLSMDETIVGFEPNRSIEYMITRGGPLKHHIGVIRFDQDGEDTVVDYVIRFDGKFPGAGALVARLLRRMWESNSGRVLRQLES